MVLNVVSASPQVGHQIEKGEEFWIELDEVIESVPIDM